MIDREEERLRHMKDRLDKIPIPEEALSCAIRAGVHQESQGRTLKKKAIKMIWPAAAAAVLLLAFVLSIRISPAFAQAVSSLPGMAPVVELIQNDKGMKAIIDNEYYEELHVTDNDGSFTITLNGIIADQSGMVISFTVDSAAGLKDPFLETPELYHNGQLIEHRGISFNYPSDDGKISNEQLIHYNFAEPLAPDVTDFELRLKLREGDTSVFSLPFTLKKPIAQSKSHQLNQTVTIGGQKLTIRSIDIHPLRVEVNVMEDPDNTMDILQYEDMRLESESGEVWSSISNGITATWEEDGSETYFLQSNFFTQPDRLVFRMSRLQALQKTEQLVVNTLTGKVLETPSDGKLEVTKLSPTLVETKLKTGAEFGYGYLRDAVDSNGKTIDLASGGSWQIDDYSYSDLTFKNGDYSNPITIHFFAYPNYIEGDVTVRLE